MSIEAAPPVTPGQRRRLLALLGQARHLREADLERHLDLALADHDEWAEPTSGQPYDVLMLTGPDGYLWRSSDDGITWRRRPGDADRAGWSADTVGRMTRVTIVPPGAATAR